MNDKFSFRINDMICSTFQKRKLGPGSYEIKDFVDAMNDKPVSVRGICDARAPRFGRNIKVRFSHIYELLL